MTPSELDRSYAEGIAALQVTLGIRKCRGDDVAVMLSAIAQSKDAWLASRLEDPCPGCGAQAGGGVPARLQPSSSPLILSVPAMISALT